MTVTLLWDHLQVGDGAGAARAPVDQVGATVDETLPVEAHERGAHGVAQILVEGEALPRPIARDTQPLSLVGDTTVVDVFPLPHFGDEPFAPQIVAGEALFAQFPFHHILGGDAGMVGAREVEGLVAIHTIIAGHQVLDSGDYGVAQMKRASDVGRRQGDAPARAILRG